MGSTIHIGQLNVRVPGESAETGHNIAKGLAESLAQKAPAGMRHQIGAMNVRVQVAVGASEAEMSDAIAEAIVEALHRGSKAARARRR